MMIASDIYNQLSVGDQSAVDSFTPQQRSHFDTCLNRGCAPRMAVMLTMRQFPGLRGLNSNLLQGRLLGESLAEKTPFERELLLSEAKKAGVNVDGKTYMSGFAQYPGDPRAWFDDTGDIIREAKRRNLNVRGVVNHEGYEVEPPKSVGLAQDIVDDEVNRRIIDDPGLALKREQVEADVRDAHTPVWKAGTK